MFFLVGFRSTVKLKQLKAFEEVVMGVGTLQKSEQAKGQNKFESISKYWCSEVIKQIFINWEKVYLLVQCMWFVRISCDSLLFASLIKCI